MANPTAAMLVIGDEILSGRTRDSNMHHLARVLADAGIDLKEVRIVGDDEDAIVEAVNALRQRYDMVFTSGGIGPTHDDITADAIAKAFGVKIGVREDARRILEERYEQVGTEINDSRLRMARIPDGAELIDNPLSGAPGFSLENVHVMAGVPAVFEAMVASLLPRLTSGTPLLSQSYRIDQPEGNIAGALAEVAKAFPDLFIGSYPFQQQGALGTNVVVRGHDGVRIDEAMTRLAELFPQERA